METGEGGTLLCYISDMTIPSYGICPGGNASGLKDSSIKSTDVRLSMDFEQQVSSVN